MMMDNPKATFVFDRSSTSDIPPTMIPSLDLCASTATRRSEFFAAGDLAFFRFAG